MQQRGISALAAADGFISSMPTFIVPLRSINILGINGLRVLLDFRSVETTDRTASLLPERDRWIPPAMESLDSLISTIEQQRHGVIMTMGKGGVGKTTVAAAIAVLAATVAN